MNILQNFDFSSGATITGLGVSTADGMPVVHQQLSSYVTQTSLDTQLDARSWKDPVVALADSNIDLSTFAAGGTIDGVTLSTGDRFALTGQTDASENGIYTAPVSAPAARASDANTSSELDSCSFFVQQGSSYADTSWTQTTDSPTVDTDNLVFVRTNTAGANTAGAGLTLTGLEFSIGAGQIVESMLDSGIDAETFAISSNYSASAGTVAAGDSIEDAIEKIVGNVAAISTLSKHAETANLVANTGYVVTHNIDQDVNVSVYDSNNDLVSVEIERTSATTATITSVSNESNVRIVVIG